MYEEAKSGSIAIVQQNPSLKLHDIHGCFFAAYEPMNLSFLTCWWPCEFSGFFLQTGIYNFCNPGAISHNQVLELYRDWFVWWTDLWFLVTKNLFSGKWGEEVQKYQKPIISMVWFHVSVVLCCGFWCFHFSRDFSIAGRFWRIILTQTSSGATSPSKNRPRWSPQHAPTMSWAHTRCGRTADEQCGVSM